MEGKEKYKKRIKRKKRVRAKIAGTGSRPRFSVFRSNKHLVLQLIDDEKGKSLLQISDVGRVKKKGAKKETKTEAAYKLGEIFAEKAKEKKIKSVVFDRGGYKYTGRVKAVADGARKGSLVF
ncbi:50S ribosomal protein L18 [Patescibacteria group bacterium]|nr:50S ribosomal protein L18 [Patescibacteria group bacterium]